MHHYNGIPIKSWYHEKDDIELKRICPILIKLNNFHDIRTEISKIIVDDIINWKKIEKWILKDKKKQIKSVEKGENLEFTSTDNEISNKENDRYQEINKKKEVSKENMNTPINKRLYGMKNNKTIQNFFCLNSKKIVKNITKNNNNNNKSKNTTNTLSNLETTINNNTLNNTIQIPGSNENPKVQITNSSVGKNKNPSSSKSNLIKSCQKMNTILSITTKKSNSNINTNSSQTFNRLNNKNELSLLLSITNDEHNIKQENKTRNLIYSLHTNKTCRTNAIVLNNTQESILNINEEDNDKKERGQDKKNKSSRSIMKTKSKNPLSTSNNHTKNHYSKLDLQHNSTSSIIKSVAINSKPSQRKLLINTIKIRKMNTTPRQINLSGFKEIDLTGKSENYNLEKSKANMTLKKSNYVKEIKEKILLNGNDPISNLGSEFSRNNAFLTNSLLYNSSSNVKVKINESNFALNKSKQTSRFLVNHKKNISFKF